MATRIFVLQMCALLACVSELRSQSMPWQSAEIRAVHDSQPRDLLQSTVEYGRYLTPRHTLAGNVVATWIGGFSSVEPGMTATASLPAARLGLEARLSTLLGEEGASVPILWDGRARLHLGADVSALVLLSRSRYTATLASLETRVLVQTVEARIDRAGAPGWAGELVARRESYGDGNPVITTYGWVLAPLSRSERHSVRAGYSLARQDAAQSNWVPDERRREGVGLPAASPEAIPGHYDPYYTPHDVLVHSLLGAAALAVGGGWIVINGGYSVHATEVAPVLQRPAPQQVDLLFHDRTFSSYRASADLTLPMGVRTSATLGLVLNRTAYFRETGARFAIVRVGVQ